MLTMNHDFVAIGDTVVDDFIKLKDARVNCDINDENCTISMRFADKIPFESSTIVYGVGNAANAAVSASRLGLKAALVTTVGKDDNGKKILHHLKKEKISTNYVRLEGGAPTNYHYVLWYESDRTILVNHHPYAYSFPKNIKQPKAVYLTSLASGTETYHRDIGMWLEKNPNIFFAFQPGTFQIKLGAEILAPLYRRANVFFANKEEYQRILKLPQTHTDIPDLLKKMRALGPKMPFLTDGRNGAYALLENETVLHVPIFPDPKPPLERTGAGDAFASTTTVYLLQGLPVKDAMFRGTVNSAYVVQAIGAQEGLLKKKDMDQVVESVTSKTPQ